MNKNLFAALAYFRGPNFLTKSLYWTTFHRKSEWIFKKKQNTVMTKYLLTYANKKKLAHRRAGMGGYTDRIATLAHGKKGKTPK